MSFFDGIHRLFGVFGRITFCTDGSRVEVVDGVCAKCGDPVEGTGTKAGRSK